MINKTISDGSVGTPSVGIVLSGRIEIISSPQSGDTTSPLSPSFSPLSYPSSPPPFLPRTRIPDLNYLRSGRRSLDRHHREIGRCRSNHLKWYRQSGFLLHPGTSGELPSGVAELAVVGRILLTLQRSSSLRLNPLAITSSPK